MVFQSIERHARMENGYASLMDVDAPLPNAPLKDEMPSYFLAETYVIWILLSQIDVLTDRCSLKYLYLLFTDEDIIPLSKYVFNTEAHPLPIFDWSSEEKEAYGIAL